MLLRGPFAEVRAHVNLCPRRPPAHIAGNTRRTLPQWKKTMNPAKLTLALAQRLAGCAPGEVLDLVVELRARRVEATPGTAREERIAPVRDGFEADASPVSDAIRRLGGEVLDRAWINQTLRVRLPAGGVAALGELSQVAAIDLPRALAADRS